MSSSAALSIFCGPRHASEMIPLIHNADAMDARLSRQPRLRDGDLASLAERRRDLLAGYLGRQPDSAAETLHCIGDSNTMFFAGAERLRKTIIAGR